MDGPALASSYLALQRYAGWLNRDRASVVVRADVQALGAAIDTGTELSALLQSLDANLACLPNGDIRKILLVAAGHIRRAIAEP